MKDIFPFYWFARPEHRVSLHNLGNLFSFFESLKIQHFIKPQSFMDDFVYSLRNQSTINSTLF